MTIRDLNPGATIAMIGEEIIIADKATRRIGPRFITEFKVLRTCCRICRSGLWVSGAQVQQWLDTARWIENPIVESEE